MTQLASQIRSVMSFRNVKTMRMQELLGALANQSQTGYHTDSKFPIHFRTLSVEQRYDAICEMALIIPEWLCVKDLPGTATKGKIVKLVQSLDSYTVQQKITAALTTAK